jgi:hypothetical protein
MFAILPMFGYMNRNTSVWPPSNLSENVSEFANCMFEFEDNSPRMVKNTFEFVPEPNWVEVFTFTTYVKLAT